EHLAGNAGTGTSLPGAGGVGLQGTRPCFSCVCRRLVRARSPEALVAVGGKTGTGTLRYQRGRRKAERYLSPLFRPSRENAPVPMLSPRERRSRSWPEKQGQVPFCLARAPLDCVVPVPVFPPS